MILFLQRDANDHILGAWCALSMVAKCFPSWRIGVCAEVGSAEFRTPLYIILATPLQ